MKLRKFQNALAVWRESGVKGVIGRAMLRLRQKRPCSGRKATSPDFSVPLPREHAAMLSPKALIIAELSILQCRKYRVEQKVKMLEIAGWTAKVVPWYDSVQCRNEMQTASLVIVYRSPFTKEIQGLFSEARRLGIRVGYDIDDLVFDVDEYSHNRNIQSISALERKELLAGAVLYRDALAAADFSITSTPTLAGFMRKVCKGQCYIVPNVLDDTNVRTPVRYQLGVGGEVVIGYGSGTRTHDADFYVCAPAVLRILSEHPNVIFALHGTLTLPKSFDRFSSRIRRIPFVPFSEYLDVSSRFDVNLAPLEPTVFNDCKSNIKFLESACNGVPTVASPCAEFLAAIDDGVNGFLASTEEEWHAALEKLVESSGLRRKVGEAAKRTAETEYSLSSLVKGTVARLLREQAPEAAPPPSPARRRILAVNVLYAPVSFGGATVLAENLVGEFAKRCEVAVFTSTMNIRHAPGHITRYENGSVPCFVCETAVPADPMRNYESPETAAAFRAVLLAFRPNVVHFNSIQFMGVEMLQICQEAGIPYVVTAHDAWWICPRQFMLDGDNRFCGQDEAGIDLYRCASCTPSEDLFSRWRLMQEHLRRSAAVLTPSDYQRDLYVKSGFPEELVCTNRNGIVPSADVSPHRLHKTVTFAYLGGRCAHKGYYMLLRMAKMLHGDFRIKLVDISLRFDNPVISAFEWPDPSKVEVCRPFDICEIDEFYGGIDVLLFPSCWKESFGLTVREALVRNVWVIATDAGGDIEHDLKNGENGDLLAMGDEVGFVAAMQRIIDNPERLEGYDNPYRASITTVAQQAEEALGFLLDAAETGRPNGRVETALLSRQDDDLAEVCRELRQDLALVTGRYDEMRTSTCWRITGPIRMVLDFLKRTIRSCRNRGSER